MADRTFHYKASWANYCGITVVAAAALYVFWSRSPLNALVGLLLMVAVVLMVERVIHTVYILTDDGRLVISNGRFSRRVAIDISSVMSVKIRRMGVLPVRCVVIEYGLKRFVAVQPDNAQAFVDELKRRLQLIEKQTDR